MWWDPLSPAEAQLAAAIDQLKEWFSNQVSGEEELPPLSWGYGSIWVDELKRLAPFVLLNPDYFYSNQPLFRIFPIEFFTRVDEPPRSEPLPSPSPWPSGTLKQFPEISLPLYGMLATEPTPSVEEITFEEQMILAHGVLDDFVRIREPIVSGRFAGTAAVSIGGGQQLLTAGHVFPLGRRSRVEVLRRKFYLLPSREPLGYVRQHVTPSGTDPGWDAAVIHVIDAVPPKGVLVERVVERFDEPEPIFVHGALTGFVSDAVVQGALIATSFANGKKTWKNCWIMAPSGVLKAGDSGSAVFTRRDRRFLGMYVGSSRLVASDKALFHYVQDACTLQKEVLTKWGVSLFQ